MQFETLKRSHLKRNIVIGVVAVAIISAIILNFTKAKYRVTQSIPLVNGTINYSPGDIIISAYFNGELLENFPTKNDGYSVESITCDKGASATFDEDIWEIEVTNLVTKGTKCNVIFTENQIKNEIIKNYPTILTRNDFSVTVTETTTGTIYKSLDETQYDNDGEVYYFAGNPKDNWVKLGRFYWRIIRINGDGSIRMIYQGTSVNSIEEATEIDTSSFNSSYNDNAYVGFMYGTRGSSTYEQTHANINNSTVKGILDKWYQNNLEDDYANYIDINVGFCNDRTLYSGNGTGINATDYTTYNRLNNKQPSFKCNNNSDLFTTDKSDLGNRALTYPIGLITADEVAYAGGTNNSDNTSYYLYTNSDYWTMSPPSAYRAFYGATMYLVSMHGSISYGFVNNIDGIRPVINLKADVKLIGTGTTSDPYRIEGAE